MALNRCLAAITDRVKALPREATTPLLLPRIPRNSAYQAKDSAGTSHLAIYHFRYYMI